MKEYHNKDEKKEKSLLLFRAVAATEDIEVKFFVFSLGVLKHFFKTRIRLYSTTTTKT